jgi:hypothetical protein
MKSPCKERILAVERILTTRPKTVPEILMCLEMRYDILAERKTIYDDIAVLTMYMNIQHNKKGFYVVKGGGLE